MPEKQDAKLVWMGDIMDKAVALGASRILLGHHRNAENHFTADEAAEQMRATIGTLAEMARERGLKAIVSNAVPFAVKDSDAVITQKLEAEIQKLDPDYRTVVTIDRR